MAERLGGQRGGLRAALTGETIEQAKSKADLALPPRRGGSRPSRVLDFTRPAFRSVACC
jgi:hypothetical protein